jgi:YHS domain-containing protein
MEKCPICGLEVDKDRPAATLKYQAETYYFSSPECRDEFMRNPERYAGRRAQSPAA